MLTLFFSFKSQYDYFFENAAMPLMSEAPEYASVSPPELQTNLLLDNVAKIERKLRTESEQLTNHDKKNYFLYYFLAFKERDGARFVSKFVQAATNRKIRKNSHRKSTVSSLTPDTLSLDSSTVSIIAHT